MRCLYTLEVRSAGRWLFVDAFQTLKTARWHRDGCCGGYVTRIRKWVPPCKKVHR